MLMEVTGLNLEHLLLFIATQSFMPLAKQSSGNCQNYPLEGYNQRYRENRTINTWRFASYRLLSDAFNMSNLRQT